MGKRHRQRLLFRIMKIFIDDIEENVKSAAAVGINAIHITGIAPLRESLLRLGVKLDRSL